MKAVILAAGYATRLYPLTIDKPKCLLTVGGKTILDSLCEKLAKLPSLDEIVIVTNAKFYDQLQDWKKTKKSGPALHVLNDGTLSNDTRLGAIGDFNLAIQKRGLKDDLILLASDNLFDRGFDEFLHFAQEHDGAVSVALHDIGDPKLAAKKFGVLEINDKKEVTRIEEKPDSPRTSLIGMGVYFFPAATLSKVPEYLASKEAKDAPGYYITWLLGKVKIFGFVFSGLWYDIGDLQALEEANKIFKEKR